MSRVLGMKTQMPSIISRTWEAGDFWSLHWQVTVDDLNGSVTEEMLYKGEPISFGDSDDGGSEQWAFIDGQWRYVDDEECPSF